ARHSVTVPVEFRLSLRSYLLAHLAFPPTGIPIRKILLLGSTVQPAPGLRLNGPAMLPRSSAGPRLRRPGRSRPAWQASLLAGANGGSPPETHTRSCAPRHHAKST